MGRITDLGWAPAATIYLILIPFLFLLVVTFSAIGTALLVVLIGAVVGTKIHHMDFLLGLIIYVICGILLFGALYKYLDEI